MVEPLRHRQTKGAETDMPGLPPPRHFPTLPLLNASAKGFRRFLRRFRRPCAVPHSGCPWARFFDTGRRSAESRSLVCRMLLLARQRGLCSFPCCDHREGRIPERSHRLRGVGGERPDPPFRHLSCPCPALRSLAPSSLDRRVAAPAARCPSISLVQNGALAQRRSKFGERGHRFLPHFPHSAVDMWRPGDLGSFSARPSLSARQCISAHTSSGVMPHSCHSTTKW